jgi:hypothetical protein
MGAMILGLLGAILLSLLIRWLGVEISVWHKPICQWLVRVAAGRLPADERAAAESEWLAVIGDMRSPTAQLLHSLSFTLSALRIRKAIAPEEAHVASRSKIVIITIQMGVMGAVTGAMSSFLFDHKDAAVEIVQQHVAVSKPVALAVAVAMILVSGVMAYVNHRFMVWYFSNHRWMMWYLSRRARRWESTPIE